MRVEKILMQTLASQLSCNSCSRLTGDMRVEKTLHTNSSFSTLITELSALCGNRLSLLFPDRASAELFSRKLNTTYSMSDFGSH